MENERRKNAARNIVFGTVLKVYQVLAPFFLRTAMIYFMGIKYVGLNGLFVSVLQVLNLAELGVGSAMVFSMYKPITENDTETICALLKLYRLYYRIIGTVIAAAGLLITPIVPKLINGNVPEEINVYVLYLLNLGTTVLSYWLFAWKTSIFMAYQRNDIISKITIITSTMQYIAQIIVIWFLGDYYLFVIANLAYQILTNIITAIAADRLYPQYKPAGILDNEKKTDLNTRIKDLFTAKVGEIIVNSVDTIVISTFLGLTILAVYQNYYYIMASVISFITVIFTSVTAGIGNSLIVESEKKNFSDLKKFTFVICFVSCFCSCCFLCVYQPFMEIWMGMEYMLDYTAVVLFVIYFYTFEINQLLNTYKDAAGIWHKDRFRPLITAGTNLAMNLIMVNFLGIYGVLLSTVISTLVIGMPWLIHNLFSCVFKKELLREYLKMLLYYIAVSVVICFITAFICNFINLGGWLTFIIRLAICIILPNLIFALLNIKNKELRDSISLVKNMIKK